MRLIDLLVVVVSAGVVLWILFDALELMLLPRRVTWPLRFARVYFRVTWLAWRTIGMRLRRGRRREGFLSIYGPLSLVSLLAVWVAMLIVAFGTLQWGLERWHAGTVTLENQLYLSGVTFFTLGYGDIVPQGAVQKAAAVAEAGMGFGLLAVIIGYLPVLYQQFSRREAQIIRLDVRAGSPPTATTLLVRYAEGQRLDGLNGLLAEWELWAAELVESQLSYPMLAFYRSQQEDESWLGALTAILDVCALMLVGFREINTFQARVTFGTARLALLEMARLFTPEETGPAAAVHDTSRLATPEFVRLHRTLARAGLDFSVPVARGSGASPVSEAAAGLARVEGQLAEFRALYEPYAIVLADHLLLQLPRWVAPEGRLDNWLRSEEEGAQAAKELVEGVDAVPE